MLPTGMEKPLGLANSAQLACAPISQAQQYKHTCVTRWSKQCHHYNELYRYSLPGYLVSMLASSLSQTLFIIVRLAVDVDVRE